ncbi:MULTISPECIES: ATP-grasp domain-containing protein [unclassified Methanoregula]|uniref:ATP-grasp domain-containing protein n=1 Tax=unclassified Methanoregula TaxID=2649730 RepID=UPI0009C5FC39|nr:MULTISPECIES: ATP-grasp domain-containing protein [unclassified Methanoregula]OPX65249.1 MAG: carbamoyl phosphate synthase-like protein [Methanoregula sp. PtaB.Bin085]OPY32158.1 MAG: carbamoyl phosphate synthase-like protein [Methanoregula sp. PtaU1.Bin006]
MRGRLLVAGFATRHIAQSANRAGFEVCAVDHFCDQDLAWYTQDRERFDDLADLPAAIERICRRNRFDFFVPASGAEMIPPPAPLLGTPADTAARFLDKLETQRFFESLGVTVPRLLPDDEYPAMVKPRSGAGGWRNAVIRTGAEMESWKALYENPPYIRQEIIPGTAASVCCVTDGSRAVAIAINEQILRGQGESAFGFSGSITPSEHPRGREMADMAERIAAASGCRGTIGIDFVAGDDRVAAIEVNPRFQGTVDTVEMACHASLFCLHYDAVRGNLPACRPKPCEVAVRSILFADRDMTLKTDLRALKEYVADIPWPGTFFEKDQAVVSVYGQGPDRAAALAMLDKHISSVRQYMR